MKASETVLMMILIAGLVILTFSVSILLNISFLIFGAQIISKYILTFIVGLLIGFPIFLSIKTLSNKVQIIIGSAILILPTIFEGLPFVFAQRFFTATTQLTSLAIFNIGEATIPIISAILFFIGINFFIIWNVKIKREKDLRWYILGIIIFIIAYLIHWWILKMLTTTIAI